jgi:hypothetical protein
MVGVVMMFMMNPLYWFDRLDQTQLWIIIVAKTELNIDWLNTTGRF